MSTVQTTILYVISRAGSGWYHGRCRQNTRIFDPLEEIDEYRTLDPGGENNHPCKFLIANNAINAFTSNSRARWNYVQDEKSTLQLYQEID